MKLIPSVLQDVYLFEPTVFTDDRGYFYVPFNKLEFEKQTHQKINFIQDNESRSSYGILRGLHFQKPPYTQAKLVRASQGEVLDVIVDLRPNSPTYGQSESFVLNEENKRQLFVPRGFAHGFAVLSNFAVFNYKVDNMYNPESESGIAWNDPTLNINWQIPDDHVILSAKDQVLDSFDSYKKSPFFQ